LNFFIATATYRYELFKQDNNRHDNKVNSKCVHNKINASHS